jgi:hypothetical protein
LREVNGWSDEEVGIHVAGAFADFDWGSRYEWALDVTALGDPVASFEGPR